MNKLNELIELTELWFKDVGLLEKGTAIKQAEKGVEEANEYLEAVNSGDRAKQVDELGDKLVTMIGDSLINDIPLHEALFFAYQKIQNRVGKGAVIDGTFVKEEDIKTTAK